MKLGFFKKGQKGFTLVELMVVMAIMAVLASIVLPAVTGTKQTSTDAQVKQDASTVVSAVGKYNADANMAEGLITTTPAVLAETSTSQVISNKWPEQTISANYTAEFPANANTVVGVNIVGTDGSTILYGTGQQTNNLAAFVSAYNALNIDTLISGGYLQQRPNGVNATFSTAKAYHNYLWLVEKVLVGSDADGGRVVEVYSLTNVQTSGSTDNLTYKRIF